MKRIRLLSLFSGTIFIFGLSQCAQADPPSGETIWSPSLPTPANEIKPMPDKYIFTLKLRGDTESQNMNGYSVVAELRNQTVAGITRNDGTDDGIFRAVFD